MANAVYDFLVVGAGSAGSVIAGHLAKSFHVGLVEAGEANPGTCFMRRPADFLKTFDSHDDWGYKTVPQERIGGRCIRFPRGKGLGGSTRINASIWLPPTQTDLEKLQAQLGGSIAHDSLQQTLQSLTKQVAPEPPRWLSRPANDFIAAAKQLGLNAHAYQRMNRRGVRLTAADSFLLQPNVTPEIICGAVARRLVLKGNQITAVEIETHSETAVLQTRFGAILAAGAIETPSLLIRSGLGSTDGQSDASREQPIETNRIGFGLRDHLVIPVVYRTKKNFSLPEKWSPADLARWQAIGTGPVTCNLAEAGCLINTPQGPIQIFVTATDYLRYPQSLSEPSMSFGIVVSNPRSKGSVSVDPNSIPLIDPGYWTCESDVLTAFNGLKIVRELANTGPLSALCDEEVFPGKRSDNQERFFRIAGRGAQSLYHPVGTCALGPTRTSWVDTDFRFRNVQGLWIADASILGFMPTSNPNPLILSLALIAGQRIAQAV